MPYTWSIASGSLPAGLALNTSSGAITGTPTAAGTFNFTARVSDAEQPGADRDRVAEHYASPRRLRPRSCCLPMRPIPSASTLPRSCWRRG